MSERLTVDFIGIGAPRCGTSWLSSALRCHQQIGISEPKEIRYFNKIGTRLGNELNTNYKQSISWYENHFRHCKPHQLKGEFTPFYLYDESAPQRIKHFYPNAKLILNLRNPLDRAYSHYWAYRGASRIEDCSFEQAMETCPNLVEMGYYTKYLKHYLDTFSREQILIVVFDDILTDPEKVLKDVLKFLKVDVVVTHEMINSYKNSSSEFKRSIMARDFIYKTSRFLVTMKMSPLLSLLRQINAQKFITKLNATMVNRPPMNPQTRESVFNLFKDDIQQLGNLMSRDVSHWR